MKRIAPILVFLFFILTGASGQVDSSFQHIKTIKGDITSFTVDNLDNIYILNSSDQLKKLDADGDSIGVYNDVRKFGKVSYIDVSNPLRVMLYYKDFSTVVVLDRLLNIRNSIDLRQQNIFQVQALSLSYDNKIWLYDEMENKLKKIDEDGKLLFETTDFRQLFDQAPLFTSIADHDGFIYLYDTLRGVFVFDYYGALKNRIQLTGWSNFKVAGKYLFGIRNDSLFRYQLATFFLQDVALPRGFKDATAISFTSTRAYALKKDGLEIYSLR